MSTLNRWMATALLSLTCSCGQAVVPADGAMDDAVVSDPLLLDGAAMDDVATRSDAANDDHDAMAAADATPINDAVAADAADTGIAGEYPPPDARFTGQSCNTLPFAPLLPIEDLSGPLPYPLTGGGTIVDGVYRTRRITRYLDGRPITPGTSRFESRIISISRGEWTWSGRSALTDPRSGGYVRANFTAVRHSPYSYRNIVVCPVDQPQISIIDTFETDGNVLRIQSGDSIYEMVRD